MLNIFQVSVNVHTRKMAADTIKLKNCANLWNAKTKYALWGIPRLVRFLNNADIRKGAYIGVKQNHTVNWKQKL